MPEKKLEQLRTAIDSIDDQIIKLMDRRLQLVEHIGEHKSRHHLTITDENREASIRERIASTVQHEQRRGMILSLYGQLFTLSRQHQRQREGRKSVGYLGGEGSHSDEAARAIYPEGAALVGADHFCDLIDRVASGELDEAVLPIENSTTGNIDEVYDLLVDREVHIVGEIYRPILHYLIGKKGADPKSLRTIYSHPQGFAQCEAYLKEHLHADHLSMASTDAAVRKAAEIGCSDTAAIGSPHAAKTHGLELIAGPIQDRVANRTRFIIISREQKEEGEKVTAVFETPHKPGALANILSLFSEGNLNLSHIASRPNKHEDFGYHFFVDIEGCSEEGTLERTLAKVRRETAAFQVLGRYSRVK